MHSNNIPIKVGAVPTLHLLSKKKIFSSAKIIGYGPRIFRNQFVC